MVFKITPAGIETVLHSFTGGITDGFQPQAALIAPAINSMFAETTHGYQFVHKANMGPCGFVDSPAFLGKDVYLT